MAKEKFERTKPHVNVGTNNSTLEDTSGALLVSDSSLPVGNDSGSEDAGASVISYSGPGSPTPSIEYTASVAFPIDGDFQFDPNSSGPAEWIDFQLEVMPLNVVGTNEVEISLAILQGESYVFSRSGESLAIDGTETGWVPLGLSRALPSDFVEADGGGGQPDFSQPFQFGYSFTSEYTNSAIDVDLALDNMLVEITTVPEPTSLVLGAALGASLLWRRWWESDKDAD